MPNRHARLFSSVRGYACRRDLEQSEHKRTQVNYAARRSVIYAAGKGVNDAARWGVIYATHRGVNHA